MKATPVITPSKLKVFCFDQYIDTTLKACVLHQQWHMPLLKQGTPIVNMLKDGDVDWACHRCSLEASAAYYKAGCASSWNPDNNERCGCKACNWACDMFEETQKFSLTSKGGTWKSYMKLKPLIVHAVWQATQSSLRCVFTGLGDSSQHNRNIKCWTSSWNCYVCMAGDFVSTLQRLQHQVRD